MSNMIVIRRNANEISNEVAVSVGEDITSCLDTIDFINLDDLYENGMSLYKFIGKVQNKIVEIDKKYNIMCFIDNQSLATMLFDINRYDELNGIKNKHPMKLQLELLSGIINNFNGDVFIHKLERDYMGNVL